MSVDAMELLILIVAAVLIAGAVAECFRILLRYVEENRERWRRDAWIRRQR